MHGAAGNQPHLVLFVKGPACGPDVSAFVHLSGWQEGFLGKEGLEHRQVPCYGDEFPGLSEDGGSRNVRRGSYNKLPHPGCGSSGDSLTLRSGCTTG